MEYDPVVLEALKNLDLAELLPRLEIFADQRVKWHQNMGRLGR